MTVASTTAQRITLPNDGARPYRVCCVCHGNICRSPIAETVLRDQLAKAGLGEWVAVDSAGIAAERGHPMDRRAVALLQSRGYTIAPHQGRQFGAAWLAERDLVLAMDAHNLAVLRRLQQPTPGADIRLFGEIAGMGGASIPNPWAGTPADFARVLHMLETGMAVIVAQLAAEATQE
jgi:protein-tyrosine phosphatase